jgi:hypothetical protein
MLLTKAGIVTVKKLRFLTAHAVGISSKNDDRAYPIA